MSNSSKGIKTPFLSWLLSTPVSLWVVAVNSAEAEGLLKADIPSDMVLVTKQLDEAQARQQRPVVLTPAASRLLVEQPEGGKESFWWAFLHNCVAHPVMFLTRYPKWSERFHYWTALKSWPADSRPSPTP